MYITRVDSIVQMGSNYYNKEIIMLAHAIEPKVEIAPELLMGWQKIISDPIPGVLERISSEESVPSERVDEAVVEYRKFMALLLLGNRGLAMTSKLVDEVWHAHILFTIDYASFCDEAFGRFVHHVPNTSYAPLSPGGGQRFREAYQQVFGEVPSIWGQVEMGRCILDPPICDDGGGKGCGECGGECGADDPGDDGNCLATSDD